MSSSLAEQNWPFAEPAAAAVPSQLVLLLSIDIEKTLIMAIEILYFDLFRYILLHRMKAFPVFTTRNACARLNGSERGKTSQKKIENLLFIVP